VGDNTVVNQDYYDTTTKLEEQGINEEYIMGWQEGYLGNPKRETQRLTEAYEAGYGDGESHKTDGAANWKN